MVRKTTGKLNKSLRHTIRVDPELDRRLRETHARYMEKAGERISMMEFLRQLIAKHLND